MRISVTSLDAYLLYRDGDFMPLADLLARLRGEGPVVPKMEAGRAFHAILEHASPGAIVHASRDGWSFDFDRLDSSLALPPVRELKGSVEIATASGPVTLVGVVDGMGGAVCDYKLTEAFDADKYMDAMQWRSYLMMFGRTRFDYEVFVGDIDEDERHVRVKEHHHLAMFRYPDMERDVMAVVSELAELIAKRAPDLAART